MNKYNLFLFAAALCSLSPLATAIPSGAAAGMDLTLVQNIKNYAMPKIIADINNLQLPRIDYKGGYVEALRFSFAMASNNSV